MLLDVTGRDNQSGNENFGRGEAWILSRLEPCWNRLDRTGTITAFTQFHFYFFHNMVSAETVEIKLIFSQYCIDKDLSTLDAYNLSFKQPADIAKKIKGLKKFEGVTFRDSIRAVRTTTANNLDMERKKRNASGQPEPPLFGGAARPPASAYAAAGSYSFSKEDANTTPKKKRATEDPSKNYGSDYFDSTPGSVPGSNHVSNFYNQTPQVPTSPFRAENMLSTLAIKDSADYEPKDYIDTIRSATTQAKLVGTNQAYFKGQIAKTVNHSRPEAVQFAKECAGTEESLTGIELSLNREDKIHYHAIADAARIVSQTKEALARLQTELAEAEKHETFVRERQLMSTGKARAFIAIVRKGLRCIDEAAVFEDFDDPMALNGAKEKWCNSLVEVQ